MNSDRSASEPTDIAALLPVTTLVLWLACLTVGGLGFRLPYPHPRTIPKPPEPTQAELLNVELSQEPRPQPDVPPPVLNPSQPPPLLEPLAPPQAPPLTAVAAPSPAVAFALPVQGPVRVVEARQASYTQAAAPVLSTAVSAPVPQPLTFGSGEGKQPAPDYPSQAAREGQEGIVGIRFSVGGNGRVLAAEAVKPTPWPLLNAAALRAVRERWRFRPGPIRACEVAIRFELQK